MHGTNWACLRTFGLLQTSVREVKKKIHAAKAKLYPARQRLTLPLAPGETRVGLLRQGLRPAGTCMFRLPLRRARPWATQCLVYLEEAWQGPGGATGKPRCPSRAAGPVQCKGSQHAAEPCCAKQHMGAALSAGGGPGTSGAHTGTAMTYTHRAGLALQPAHTTCLQTPTCAGHSPG